MKLKYVPDPGQNHLLLIISERWVVRLQVFMGRSERGFSLKLEDWKYKYGVGLAQSRQVT